MNTPDIYDDSRDEALAGRLSAALDRTAAGTPAPADAWASFQARLGGTGSATPLFEAVGYAEAETVTGHDDVLSDAGAPAAASPAASPSGPGWTAPPRTRASRWRVPLIAAASVVVVAAGVATASTGLFGAGGGDGTPAAAPSTSDTALPPQSEPVGISIECAATEPEPCTSVTGATLRFVDDPDLMLQADFFQTEEGRLGTRAGAATDGTGNPLGFLMASGNDRVDIVWGAESPDVSTVLVRATRASGTDDEISWTFDSNDSSVVPQPYSLTTVWKHAVWTEISAGWHGYAVHLPEGYTTVKVTAIGYADQTLQARTLNVATGEKTDQVLTMVPGALSTLATMTGEPTQGVLSEIDASKRAEAIHSAVESANASMSAASSAAEREARQEAEAKASAITKHVDQTELQVERATEEALAAQAGLSSAEEVAARARAEADALPANASDAERAEAEAKREMAELSVAAAQEALQRAQALLDEAQRQAALASAAAKSLAEQNATTAGN